MPRARFTSNVENPAQKLRRIGPQQRTDGSDSGRSSARRRRQALWSSQQSSSCCCSPLRCQRLHSWWKWTPRMIAARLERCHMEIRRPPLCAYISRRAAACVETRRRMHHGGVVDIESCLFLCLDPSDRSVVHLCCAWDRLYQRWQRAVAVRRLDLVISKGATL